MMGLEEEGAGWRSCSGRRALSGGQGIAGTHHHVSPRELEDLDEDGGARQALQEGQGAAGALLCVSPRGRRILMRTAVHAGNCQGTREWMAPFLTLPPGI